MIKFSVIVPIYKVEKYLRQCVESILAQTYRNIEVILVDDGSPDACPQICDEYEKKDDRVIVIHKANGGLSDARNAGIKRAQGNYLMFLDSDDNWQNEYVLEKIAARIQLTDAEVLSFSYKDYYEEANKERSHFLSILSMPLDRKTKDQQLKYLTDNGAYISSAWNKAIKRNTILKNDLFFPIGVTSEDIPWCMKLMTFATSFDYLSEEVLVYRHRPGSISRTIDQCSIDNLKNNILKCLEITKDQNCSYSKYYYRYAAYQYATFIKFQSLADSFFVSAVKELAPEKWVLRFHAKQKKVRMLYWLSIFFSFEAICKFFYLCHHVFMRWEGKSKI